VSTDLLTLLQRPDWPKEIPKQEIPSAIGLLEAAKAQLWARLMEPVDTSQKTNGNEPDRLVTVKEAAPMLNVTPRWLYNHARHLPFARRLSRKALRFSEKGLIKWQQAVKHY